MLKNIKLIIAYNGSRYLGWQKTKEGPGIEETLEKALGTLLQEKIALQAASRTDAGVHADGQVVNFFSQKEPLDLAQLQRGLNAILPKDISVFSASLAESGFHPTLDCLAKEYCYLICNSTAQLPFYKDTSWHFPLQVSLSAMLHAAEHLLGTHDFSAFCNERALPKRGGICRLDRIDIAPLPERRIKISITGDRFLYKMVRNLVGTLLYVGCGKMEVDSIPHILLSKKRANAGVTAPAHGLLLKEVFF